MEFLEDRIQLKQTNKTLNFIWANGKTSKKVFQANSRIALKILV